MNNVEVPHRRDRWKKIATSVRINRSRESLSIYSWWSNSPRSAYKIARCVAGFKLQALRVRILFDIRASFRQEGWILVKFQSLFAFSEQEFYFVCPGLFHCYSGLWIFVITRSRAKRKLIYLLLLLKSSVVKFTLRIVMNRIYVSVPLKCVWEHLLWWSRCLSMFYSCGSTLSDDTCLV